MLSDVRGLNLICRSKCTAMARGQSDESAPRNGAGELAQQAKLNGRLRELQPRILRLLSKQAPSDAEKGRTCHASLRAPGGRKPTGRPCRRAEPARGHATLHGPVRRPIQTKQCK